MFFPAHEANSGFNGGKWQLLNYFLFHNRISEKSIIVEQGLLNLIYN